MKERKIITAKEAVAVIILTAINIALTYGYQCLILMLFTDRAQAHMNEVMIYLCGVPAAVTQALFAWTGRRLMRYDVGAVCRIITAGMILYIASMFLLFPRIPVPYGLIPAREMAFGFLQFLIGIFASAAAFLCAVISMIVMYAKKRG